MVRTFDDRRPTLPLGLFLHSQISDPIAGPDAIGGGVNPLAARVHLIQYATLKVGDWLGLAARRSYTLVVLILA